MAESAGEKTELPTPRKLKEARDEGNVAKSQDLTGSLVLLMGVVAIEIFGGRLWFRMLEMTEAVLTTAHAANPTRSDDFLPMVAYCGRAVLLGVLPIFLAVMVIAAAGGFGQVGLLFSMKSLQPKPNRMSPVRGVKNVVGLRAMVRLGMSLAKVVVIGLVAALIVMDDLLQIVGLGELAFLPAFVMLGDMVFGLALKLAALLLVLAIIDYSYQKWQHTEDLKMTKQDVRDEMKKMEGDPQIKQRRARIARELAMQRMAQAVPGADVVVTNPTHFSVAIKYDKEGMPAPKVVAKGQDHLALRIRTIAMEHGIPIVERKPLARALYRDVEVGEFIPPEHYAAAAEILAFVYRLGEEAEPQRTPMAAGV